MHSVRLYLFSGLFSSLLAVSSVHGSAFLAVFSEDTLGSLTASSSDPAELSGTLARGPGLDAEALFATYYDAAGWSESSSLSDPQSNDDYFEFSVSVAPGYTFAPAALDFYYEEGGNLQGPSRVSLRSSLDNYSTELFLDTNSFDAAVHNVDLSSLDEFTGTVNFRWFGYGAGNADGILGFTNNALIDVNGMPASIELSGDLAPIPEPAFFAFSMALLSLLLVSRRGPKSAR